MIRVEGVEESERNQNEVEEGNITKTTVEGGSGEGGEGKF